MCIRDSAPAEKVIRDWPERGRGKRCRPESRQALVRCLFLLGAEAGGVWVREGGEVQTGEGVQ
eukprot:11808092-Heterocapsa_arctica.AAC.1